ncbi:alpha-L-fucosidase [Litorihabitans aurantiacus]|uniref:alpha-L-fucosidase n=1 Tax=Litorihabitans aurantiacus TaxID=1930061 RepID=A0AA37UM54_9MICO|nr:alpha-L-fucosidase [Litorihabitans aurantiacus]GMA31060.1 hypothetical protein GCM10025875_10520 [Litorihabitans aurantiacus]
MGGALLTAVPTAPTLAAPTDALNVAFAGSLVGTEAYTSQGDEVLRGSLRRAQGGEVQTPGVGVTLTGPDQGILFDAREPVLGEDAMTGTVVLEAVFTPAAEQGGTATLVSAGGHLRAEITDGELRYGFESGDGSVLHEEAVPAPEAGAEHRLSLLYSAPDGGGRLEAYLDGEALPEVAADAPATVATDLGASFGFGTDVSADRSGRGLTGDLHEVRVAGGVTQTAPAVFELQPRAAATELVNLQLDGSIADDGSYRAAPTEALEGTARGRAGDEIVAGSALELPSRSSGLDVSVDGVTSRQALESGFIAEVSLTAGAEPDDLDTIVSLGGSLYVRMQGGLLRYGFDARNGSGGWDTRARDVTLPAGPHTLSVAYVPEDGEHRLVVAVDGRLLPAVTSPTPPDVSDAVTETVAFGNESNPGGRERGIRGSMDAVRFATLADGFEIGDFTLQEVDLNASCVAREFTEPAQVIEMQPTDCADDILQAASMLRPSAEQWDWQQDKLSAFIHFGINTFTQVEWGEGDEDPTLFDPTEEVDTDEWVRALADAGYRRVIYTAKHHDGFVGWQSRYTDFGVMSSPWRDGQGDILADLSASVEKYGLELGIYLSPADSFQEDAGVFGNGSTPSPRTIPTLVEGDDRAGQDLPTFTYEATDYGALFLNMLYEVLTQYGPVTQVWFDGAPGNTDIPEVYDFRAFDELIQELQPGALVSIVGEDVRWVGNEHGEAPVASWSSAATSSTPGGRSSRSSGRRCPARTTSSSTT